MGFVDDHTLDLYFKCRYVDSQTDTSTEIQTCQDEIKV